MSYRNHISILTALSGNIDAPSTCMFDTICTGRCCVSVNSLTLQCIIYPCDVYTRNPQYSISCNGIILRLSASYSGNCIIAQLVWALCGKSMPYGKTPNNNNNNNNNKHSTDGMHHSWCVLYVSNTCMNGVVVGPDINLVSVWCRCIL